MTKYTATYNGQTFTRKTDRVYTHTVVSKPAHTYEQALAAAKAFKQYGADWIAYCQEAMSPDYKYASVNTDAQRAEYARHVEVGLDVINAEVSARFVAAVEASNAENHYETFYNNGWCGRFDLAQKLADKMRKYGHRGVVILEAIAS